MDNEDSRPVVVTGEERAHPAIRLLARACIELAREQIAKDKAEKKATKPVTTGSGEAVGITTGEQPVVKATTKKPDTSTEGASGA